jgi:hypothetical protein
MSGPMDEIAIINDVVAFAQQIICRPTIELTQRRERCEELQAKLETAIGAGTSLSRFLDNGAPLLLHAIDRALFARHCLEDDRADRWDSIIGHLMPLTRRDAGDALEMSSEILRERPTR